MAAKVGLRLVSWNINGIRSVQKKGFEESVKALAPDILCLQEVRALPEQASLSLPGYHQIWNPAVKLGYSGTLTLSRQKPKKVVLGLDDGIEDNEGRVIAARFDDFWLVNVYTPNAKADLSRLSFRHKQWDPAFLRYLVQLEKDAPVIVCGDLNTAHQDIDLARPSANRKNAGFTDEERKGLDNMASAGFLDTFRCFEKGGGFYSWWSNRAGAREKNVGWRIDYFWISGSLRSRLGGAAIHPEILGSDHCPVSITLDDSLSR